VRRVVLFAPLLAACVTLTEPRHTDVDRARQAWLASNATSYTFEVAIATSWVQRTGYYRVSIDQKQVVAAFDPTGKALDGFTLTIEEIWDRLLDARSNGQLNSALFDTRGVPVEADMGPWPVDGGVHYSVRRFRRTPGA
jgi:hypothetical protein